jgi:hypothetical protein
MGNVTHPRHYRLLAVPYRPQLFKNYKNKVSTKDTVDHQKSEINRHFFTEF